MRLVSRCLLLVPVLSLVASCETQKQKDDRATEAFKRFAARTEERLKAAVLLLSETPFQLSEIPGAGQPSVEVTYDVKRSTSTVTPDAYSATLTVSLRNDGQTSSVTAEYTFTDGEWHTGMIGDTRLIERQLEKLEERRRAYLQKVASDKPDEEKRALRDLADATSLSREISGILKYSDGDSKPTRK
jgi:hypothetical protein